MNTEIVAWLKAHAIPLAGPEAGQGFADLERFRESFAAARLVSLGEATHGTREVFQWKHRLLEFCVSELGFGWFGIESSFPECEAIDAYVTAGEGTAADSLAGQRFWVWDTEEVTSLIEWMRAENLQRHAASTLLRFHGDDIQFPALAVLAVLDYLDRVAPELADRAAADLAGINGDFNVACLGVLPLSVTTGAVEASARWIEAFDEHREDWVAASSNREWALARLHCQVAHQSTVMRIPSETPNREHRDSCMAANLLALLEIEGTSAVHWAHNVHVSRAQQKEFKSQGQHLDEALGQRQVIVGFAFGEGGFQAVGADGLSDVEVGPFAPGSLDATLAQVGLDHFALDLRAFPSSGPVHDWLASEPASRSVGAGFTGDGEKYQAACDPRQNYDWLIFVARTSPARRTPSGSRPPAVSRPSRQAAPTNLDLRESGIDGVPAGWWLSPMSSVAPHQVSVQGGVLTIERRDSPWPWGQGQVDQVVDATPFRGSRVTFSADIDTELSGSAPAAQLFLRTDLPALRASAHRGAAGDPQPPPPARNLADTMWDRPARGTTSARHAVSVEVPVDALSLVFGVVLMGDGRAEFSNLSLTTSV